MTKGQGQKLSQRQERLAKALRENLKRRKQKQRKQAGEETAETQPGTKVRPG
jgi:hypothetical protein